MFQLVYQKRNRVGVHGAKGHYDVLVPLWIDHRIVRLREPPLDGFALVPWLPNPPTDAPGDNDDSNEESAVSDALGNFRRLLHCWNLRGTETDTQDCLKLF